MHRRLPIWNGTNPVVAEHSAERLVEVASLLLDLDHL